MATHTDDARKALEAQLRAINSDEAVYRAKLADLGRQRADIARALRALKEDKRGPSPLRGIERGARSLCWREAAEVLRAWRGLGELEQPFTLTTLVERLEATGWRSDAKPHHIRSTLRRTLTREFGDDVIAQGAAGPHRRFVVARPVRRAV